MVPEICQIGRIFAKKVIDNFGQMSSKIIFLPKKVMHFIWKNMGWGYVFHIKHLFTLRYIKWSMYCNFVPNQNFNFRKLMFFKQNSDYCFHQKFFSLNSDISVDVLLTKEWLMLSLSTLETRVTRWVCEKLAQNSTQSISCQNWYINFTIGKIVQNIEYWCN
jgi:hypothetical protein